MSSDQQFITTAEYAVHRNCSDSYVRRLRREGRLVNGAGKLIDWAASDAKLLDTGDPLRGGDRTGVEIGGAIPAAPGSSQDQPLDGGVREAVRRERLANARMAELKLGEQVKELTRTKEADRVVFTLVRQALERMRSIGSRLRTQLAAESDARACEALLDAEVRLICEDMQKAADDFRAMHSVGQQAAA